MRERCYSLLAIVITVLTAPATAYGSTITFSDIEENGTGVAFMSTYIAPENGFLIRDTGSSDPLALGSVQTGNTNSYAGSTGLFDNIDGGTAELSDFGTAFSLSAIDLSLFSRFNSGSITVTFTGNYIGGGTTTQSFTVTQFGFQTFAFNSTFTNLVSVDFGPQIYPFFQFDNVVVDSPTPVPEPVSVLLFGSGLGAAALRLRRREPERPAPASQRVI